jgi:hypothetical protein
MARPRKNTDSTPSTSTTEKANVLLDHPIYQKFLSDLNRNKIKLNGSIIDTPIKDACVKITAKMVQNGIEAMCFNTDFNGVQKSDYAGNLVGSPEWFRRRAFGQNDLQNNFNVAAFSENMFFIRGGIRTVPEGNGNVSLTKTLNVRIVSESFKRVQNDRLGFKAKDASEDEKNTNYLTSEEKFLDTVFNIDMRFYLFLYAKNIEGTDFAQDNALKHLVVANDEEVQKFIDDNIPTVDGVLDVDAIVGKFMRIFNENRKTNFTHRGIHPEFSLSDVSINLVTL